MKLTSKLTKNPSKFELRRIASTKITNLNPILRERL